MNAVRVRSDRIHAVRVRYLAAVERLGPHECGHYEPDSYSRTVYKNEHRGETRLFGFIQRLSQGSDRPIDIGIRHAREQGQTHTAGIVGLGQGEIACTVAETLA